MVHSYAMESFESAVKRSSADSKALYALALFRAVDTHFAHFLSAEYAALNSDSGNALHIIAPIRPPGGNIDFPENPIQQNNAEKDDFYRTLSKAKIALRRQSRGKPAMK